MEVLLVGGMREIASTEENSGTSAIVDNCKEMDALGRMVKGSKSVEHITLADTRSLALVVLSIPVFLTFMFRRRWLLDF